MLHAKLFKPLTIALVLAGCAAPKPPPAVVAPPPPPPPPPPHIGGPAAGTCDVPVFGVADGGITPLTMRVSNEGGYCAARLVASNGKPFDSYLLPIEPEHGTAKITRYDGKTSLEYTPNTGYVGKDSFTTKLIIKGRDRYTTLTVNVTVQAPGTPAAPEAAPVMQPADPAATKK